MAAAVQLKKSCTVAVIASQAHSTFLFDDITSSIRNKIRKNELSAICSKKTSYVCLKLLKII